MTTDSAPYIPFSQRTGLVPVPPQLKLGEASEKLRRLVYYAVHQDISANSATPYSYAILVRNWLKIANDLHVYFFDLDPDKFEKASHKFDQAIKQFIYRASFGKLFDFVEFILRHTLCGKELKAQLAAAFVLSGAAYRVIDDKVVAVGTEEQGAAFAKAIADADVGGAGSARTHLVAAGAALRSGEWAGCVRESINAVEAAARGLTQDGTLGAAMKTLERKGNLNPQLKRALEQLYAYTNSEGGVRHALVFKDEAQVDETDALFMLGACASFVSYLLARSGQANGPA